MASDEAGRNLAEQLARRSAEVEVLGRIGQEINATLDLETIYRVVLRTMDECFGFRHSIILVLEDSNTLRVVASRGYSDQPLGGTVPMGVGVIGTVAKRRRLLRVNHLRAAQGYFERIRNEMQEAGRATELGEVVKVPGLPDANSQIAIPLVVKDRLIGVFSVESRDPESFSQHDETLVAIVATQAAAAIQNALLYCAGEEQRKELAQAHERLTLLNETLEERVCSRTQELERANRDLRETQAQLVRSNTMVSLGTLAAGIAHELNTPMGVIHSNADVERRVARKIRAMLNDPAVAGKLEPPSRLEESLNILDEMNRRLCKPLSASRKSSNR
ncbi:MAG: GAF domain-containing protein [Acidimicrobiia bacterium]|nr:GAF domain-containing protein [Acidimicrobiia bacterium]